MRKVAKFLSLCLAVVMALELLFSPALSTYPVEAQEGQADVKYPLFLMPHYAEKKGDGHFTPSFSYLSADPTMKSMWENLSITVIDQGGKRHESGSELFNVSKEPGKDVYRYGGDYKDGEILTVIVDHNGLPDGYHMSNATAKKDEAGYAWTAVPEESYSTFKITFNRMGDQKYLLLPISFGSMDVKFDPKGGNWSGSTDPIVKTVNKDNTVEFPSDPTRDNYEFDGWYTEDTAKTRKYWDSSEYYSDYDRDWKSYNSKDDDPLYDGIFLLRAKWKELETYQLTFDPGEGHWPDGSSEPKVFDVKQGDIFTIPEGTILSGSSFQYWEGSEYYPGDQYTVEGDHTFTAHYAEWKPLETYQLTFDPGEGHWPDGSSEPKVYDVKQGEIFTIPEGTILSGSSFQYWEGSEYYPGDQYTVEGNHTFTAHYSETPIELIDSETPIELIVRPIEPASIEPASTVVIPLNQPGETSPLPTSQNVAGQMPVDLAKQLPATGSVASGLSFMVSLGLIAWGLILK